MRKGGGSAVAPAPGELTPTVALCNFKLLISTGLIRRSFHKRLFGRKPRKETKGGRKEKERVEMVGETVASVNNPGSITREK